MAEPSEEKLWDYVKRLQEHWQQWESEFAVEDGGPTA